MRHTYTHRYLAPLRLEEIVLLHAVDAVHASLLLRGRRPALKPQRPAMHHGPEEEDGWWWWQRRCV